MASHDFIDCNIVTSHDQKDWQVTDIEAEREGHGLHQWRLANALSGKPSYANLGNGLRLRTL
jgi:hypothetical protein